MSIITSLVSLSSPSGLWIVFNQFQLILLIPLIATNAPDDVVQSIVGFKFASFSMSFLPLKYFRLMFALQDRLEFEHPNSYLELIELQSTSTFYNFYTLWLIVSGLVVCHAVFQTVWWAARHKIQSEC